MFGIILKGSKLSKDQYIDAYIKDNAVPIYNVVRFEDVFKIADARGLVKTLNTTTSSGKNRVIVIQANPNTESQNALLKTLEELPNDTKIIFCGDEELLPTIQSRCFIKTLEYDSAESVFKDSDMQLVKSLISEPTAGGKIIILDKFFLNYDKPFVELIKMLRELLVNKIINGDFEKLNLVYFYLKQLDYKSGLVGSNNLNARLAAESILLKD